MADTANAGGWKTCSRGHKYRGPVPCAFGAQTNLPFGAALHSSAETSTETSIRSTFASIRIGMPVSKRIVREPASYRN